MYTDALLPREMTFESQLADGAQHASLSVDVDLQVV
jgi:hypothetical protein